MAILGLHRGANMTKLISALALAVILTGCAYVPPMPTMPPGTGIPFGLTGDVPYSQREVRALDEMIDRINAEDLAFVVHVGDITSGQGPCTDEWFLARKAQFNRIRHPFILIPGDNDWTDCHRSGMDPMERLARFREIFEAGDESLGQRRMKLERQSSDPRFAEYREHMRWQAGKVLFVTLNVQGSNNNLGRIPAMDEEYRKRMAAAFDWMEQGAAIVEQRNLDSLVFLIQANPDFEEREVKPGRPDGFADFRNTLRTLSLRLNRPVMLVHGDTHSYQQNRPLKDEKSGQPIANFVRVEVDGSPWVHWLHGTIFPSRDIPVYVAPAPAN